MVGEGQAGARGAAVARVCADRRGGGVNAEGFVFLKNASIVDITCDSDGCLERFIDRREIKASLDLHVPSSEPYFIGFFLVGAYQESLANEHNLFGAINEVEVYLDNEGSWSLGKRTKGDPIDELLACRNYNMEEISGSFQVQFDKAVEAGLISADEASNSLKKLINYTQAYPYLTNN